MELLEKIDAADVLSHLKQMGYTNITPSQLKEFMSDLKKLILYDHLSSSSGSLTSLSSSVTSDSEFWSSNETTESSNVCRESSSLQGQGPPERPTALAQSKQPLSTRNTSGSTSSRGDLRQGSSSSSSLPQKGCSMKENQPHQGRVRTKSISSDDIQEAIKPRTSFIRPWQLQGLSSGQGRTGRSDPVQLYHYYQAIWSRHKCPGEDSRADLRWVIRERMLGQDPHLFAPTQSALNPTRKQNRMRM